MLPKPLLKSRLGALFKEVVGLPFFGILDSGMAFIVVGFFFSDIGFEFWVNSARSLKVRLTDSSGIPRYKSSSPILAFAKFATSPISLYVRVCRYMQIRDTER